jgi:hypothetical protein
MTSRSENNSSYDTLSESDISDLELAAHTLTVVSDDEHETSALSDYDSESSYDPSILTDDEDFIDDGDDSDISDDSNDSSDSYEPDVATDSDEFDEFDKCSNDDDTTENDDCDSSTDDLKQGLLDDHTSEPSMLLTKSENPVGYCVAGAISVKRPGTIACINLQSGN